MLKSLFILSRPDVLFVNDCQIIITHWTIKGLEKCSNSCIEPKMKIYLGALIAFGKVIDVGNAKFITVRVEGDAR